MKTQEEKDRFSLDWRGRYLKALKNYKEHLQSTIAVAYQSAHKEQIELLELEHKIFFEEIVYQDYIRRVERYTAALDMDAKEARHKITDVIKQAELVIVEQGANNTDRLKSLITKSNTVNFHDDEQVVTLYKSIKLELSKLESTSK